MKTQLEKYKEHMRSREEQLKSSFRAEAELYKKDFWNKRRPRVERTVDEIEKELTTNILNQ